MKILKYKKMSKGKYKITFDTSELILYEDVIIKNNLLLKSDIPLRLLEKVLEENKYYEVYNISLSYIEKRLRTQLELKNYLMDKLFPEELIDSVIKSLKEEGYINDKRFIEAYINDKLNLTTKGPYKIKRELIDLGLDEYLIEEYLSTIDYNTWKNKLESIIKKRINRMTNKSIVMIKNKLKLELFNLGYQKEMIDELLNNINRNDNDSLEKEYTKIYNKYSKKYNGTSLEMQIKNYLYKKGYNLEDINNLLYEKNNY